MRSVSIGLLWHCVRVFAGQFYSSKKYFQPGLWSLDPSSYVVVYINMFLWCSNAINWNSSCLLHVTLLPGAKCDWKLTVFSCCVSFLSSCLRVNLASCCLVCVCECVWSYESVCVSMFGYMHILCVMISFYIIGIISTGLCSQIWQSIPQVIIYKVQV